MEHASPFSSQLRTNYAVTDDEIPVLCEFLAAPVSQLVALQEHIDRTKFQLALLIEQHATLSQQIEDHRALMAPIRRLPVDITQEIFLNCLPQKHNAIISPRHCPLLLTQVCSGWRHIALKTATLWASIHISVPPLFYQDRTGAEMTKRQARVINEWFGRSGACPLQVSIFEPFEQCAQSASPDMYDIIFDAIIPFSERWSTFQCYTHPIRLSRISALSLDRLPRLQSISLHGTPKNQPAFWGNSGILQAPNLCDVSYHICDAKRFPGFPIRWAWLTSLNLVIAHMKQTSEKKAELLGKLYAFLSSCTFLRIFSLIVIPSVGAVAPPIPANISLPNLENLQLSGRCFPQIHRLLDVLDVPALKSLDFDVQEFPAASLITFLRHTGQQLHTLKFIANGFSKAEVTECLSICPNLVELQFSRYHFSPLNPSEIDADLLLRLISATLRTHPSADILLRHLAVFVFRYTVPRYVSEMEVLKSLRTRNTAAADIANGISKIKRLDFTFAHPQNALSSTEIDSLAKEGVDCRFDFEFRHPSFVRDRYSATDGILNIES